jgi:PAS domain S-box-containing protein
MPALLKLRNTFKSKFDRPALRWGIVSIAAAILISTAAYSYHKIDSELTAVALSRQAAVAQLMAGTLAEKFGRSIDVGISLSTRVQFRKLVTAGKWGKASDILLGVPSDFPYIERLFITDTAGTLQADVPALPGVRGVNFASRDWFRGVSRDWRPYVSPMYVRAALPRLDVFAVAVPIKSTAGQVAGILVLQIRIENLLQWVAGINQETDTSIYIVDTKGQMMLHSGHGDQKKLIDVMANPIVQKLRNSAQGVEIGFDEFEHEESIINYAAVPEYGWGVVVSQPVRSSKVLAARDKQLHMLLAGYGFILLLGIITTGLLMRIVNERHKAESAAHFATIVNTATEAIISVNQDQRIVLFNHGAESCFGYSAAEMLGQPLDRLLPKQLGEIHRSHIQNFANAPEINRASRHMAGDREISGRRKDGTEFPVEASIAKSTVNGQTTLTVILRNVTERKQAEQALRASEERFRHTIDSMLEGCQIIDRNWRYVYINDAAEKHNRRSKEELLGKVMTDVWPGIEKTDVYSAEVRCMNERIPQHMETEFTFPNGGTGWFEIGIQPMPGGIFILSADITERKQAEMKIHQLNADLEHRVIERTAELAAVNKELEAFSYSVSHDLRAPLRSIDGFSQALLDDYADRLDDQARDFLDRVRGATQRMGMLIDDMLTLSRVTRAEMRRETVDLGALAADVLEELQKSEPERKVEWHIEPGLAADGDTQLLRVALFNLLGNAWKFTGKTANTKIEFGAIRHANGNTEFFVRDNGAGFDMRYAGKLFGAFQRLHLTSEFQGTGVGLATVQRIVHRHGGQVRAEGVPGQGATFYFTLPG